MRFRLLSCLPLLIWTASCLAQSSEVDTTQGDRLVMEYFRQQTAEITAQTLSDIETIDDWNRRKQAYRLQLLEMLGLDPFPEKTSLEPVVTGIVEHEQFVVENLHFQSMPQLYVTANLYRPRNQTAPLPAILYVCGHGGERKDGVSLGNKTHYQHHGAWFARNGYVCLTIDTIQLGEIEGIHHGTYREKMWWWNNRGYTPAGVEAWNCVRSLDYLQSRQEVDPERIGVTGRSGGGAYSWWISAIDDRIKVAVPVAGITSLHNHVVDGAVEGHCDCMFMVNTYRWDYPLVAALVAPRPLLISNSDKDRIFPLDGVIDVHAKVRRIYELHGASDRLGLQITEGPHKDTQELRVHAFRWFNRFLKQDDSLIDNNATPFFENEQLKVFESLPKDQRVTTIHESFVPKVSAQSLPQTDDQLRSNSQRWLTELTEHCFRGWPQHPEDLDVKVVVESMDGVRLSKVEFTSQQPYRLRMYLLQAEPPKELPLNVRVLDQSAWESVGAGINDVFPGAFPGVRPDSDAANRWKDVVQRESVAFVVPRGVGPTEWSRETRKRTQIRRRFMQIGQTAATMQIYDVRRAIQAVTKIDDLKWTAMNVTAAGQAAVWALYAALYEAGIDTLKLSNLPGQNRDAPDLLNVSRFVEIPHLVRMAKARVRQMEVEYRN